DGAVARLLLVEAIARPVLRFPGHKIRDDLHVLRFGVVDRQRIALLHGPAVAGLAPLVAHLAMRTGDARVGLRTGKPHRGEGPVRCNIGRIGWARFHGIGPTAAETHTGEYRRPASAAPSCDHQVSISSNPISTDATRVPAANPAGCAIP